MINKIQKKSWNNKYILMFVGDRDNLNAFCLNAFFFIIDKKIIMSQNA